MNQRIVTTHLDYLSTVTSQAPTPSGVLLQVDGEEVRLDVLRADVLRLKISRAGRFDEQPTHAVCSSLGPTPPFTVSVDEATIRVATSALTVTFTRRNFGYTIHRADGSLVCATATDKDGRSLAHGCLNDRFVVTRIRRQGDDFYGLGEKTGPSNRDGGDYALWNTDILAPDVDRNVVRSRNAADPKDDPTSTVFDPYYMSIPFFYHADPRAPGQPMAGFFVDNGYRLEFEFSQAQQYRFQGHGGQYTEYFFAGPRMADILRAYTDLTGRMARPPLWALGYHQCRWLKYSAEELLALARRFRADGVPCDVLWLDIDYMRGYRVFTWNHDLFPDPAATLAQLRAEGFRVITIIDPGVKAEPGYPVFDEGQAQGLFCHTESGALYIGQVWPGRTAFPDFAQAATRAWWGRLNAAHVQSGLAGIWNDMNEPATGVVDPMAMRFDRPGEDAPHERYHNQYAMLMAMGTVEGLLAAMPDRRTFVLSRAGFAGIQRYAANWMGDNMSRWDHLAMSIPMAMGLGLSGQPFVGADIGGFGAATHPELLVRWTQYGILTPFCRNHNMNPQDQYPWTFGKAVESLIREAIALRYRLLPYLYTAFVQASEDGRPIQRPLLFDYQDDVACRGRDDQYLLGDHLLVAPVLAAGQTARHVYLPAGGWYHWTSEEYFAGEQLVTVAAPLEEIPLFVRAGAVLPMWPAAPPSTMDFQPDTLHLHCFLPGEDGTVVSELVEDDGLSFAFRDGAERRTRFTLTREGAHVTLRAEATGQGRADDCRRCFALFVHGAEVTSVLRAGQELPPSGAGEYLLPNRGEAFTLTLTLAS